ncbi:hypothetical protein TWF730_001415 [Orbilia blumenaviensis]|uniref:Uroporphyrin-III C-methyltransferase n=1 Tax=Orbilia blumenaviensis TaxID=1796055 RepID=A0AAV9UIH8_9PEZI
MSRCPRRRCGSGLATSPSTSDSAPTSCPHVQSESIPLSTTTIAPSSSAATTTDNTAAMTAPEYPSSTVPSSLLPAPTTTVPTAIANIYTPPLLTSTPSVGHHHLIIGSNALASARCTRSLSVGAHPTFIFPEPLDSVHPGVRGYIEAAGNVGFLNRKFEVEDLERLGREDVGGFVDAVFVTLEVAGGEAATISKTCARLRIPVNVADSAALSTFTLLSTYADGPLQIGITTSGMGCKLASRLRRTIAAALPVGIGNACQRLGGLRRRVIDEDFKKLNSSSLPSIPSGGAGTGEGEEEEEDDSTDQKHSFNALVQPEDAESQKSRRMRWLSQICEYWPLQKLVDLTDEDVEELFGQYSSSSPPLNLAPNPEEQEGEGEDGEKKKKRGTISLVGSGPGNPDLLTKSSHEALLTADLILADKLVPSQVLALIPRRTTVFIARKFPGNADAAQAELLERGLEAINSGLNVVRLKQGDPYIYGRGAEEYEWFREKGVKVNVLPGITSALSAPLYACIPATHRAVADQILICTGTGRKGVAPDPPAYIKSQTTVFLMACHRLKDLVEGLVKTRGWPGEVPCAVVERASCSDQRVVRSTLQHVVAAVEEVGSRPPGLFVVGWACEVLKKPGKEGGKWSVEEGLE